MKKQDYKIYISGSNAFTIEMGNSIEESINKKVLALFYHLKNLNIPYVIDIIPAYCTVTVILNNITGLRKEKENTFSFIQKKIESAIDQCDFNKSFPSRLIEIPVCYDVSMGLDLEEMAGQNKIPVDDIISIHSKKTYHVFMIGFLPGFAYMGSVDHRIRTPRKIMPRTIVPAGSVGIAGEQTGIYPFDSPGGWNIVGRTPIKMFDVKKENPVLLNAGDEVRFISVTLKEYQSFQL
jgi:inhibitor of KinA